MRYFPVVITVFLSTITLTLAQAPKVKSSSEIFHSLQKLNFLGSALYIAAHPDDENTRLISYLANHDKARTAYLSLTRGDGGQNLIGPELRELLGVLRTQELLAARHIDGGQQFFTRAVDFGYSKHPDETLEIWNKQEVLADVIRVVRQFKPDVIINRFDHRSPGSTHGHHTSSAMLGIEAFDMAGDPNIYVDQLASMAVWQPARIFFNTSWWFYGSEEKFEKADKSKFLNLDVGVFYPHLGMSNNEIASLASSQHLCQGFGRLTTRGSENEYIELLKGTMPKNKSDIFEGINTTWSRVDGGEAIGKILASVENSFDFKNPVVHLADLLKAHKLILALKDGHWRNIKLKEIEELITSVTGLYLEVSAEVPFTNPGSTIMINIEALNRSTAKFVLKSMVFNTGVSLDSTINLTSNQKVTIKKNIELPSTTAYTSPYWLNRKGSLGMYAVDDEGLIGAAETPRAVEVSFNLDFDGYVLTMTKAVVYRHAKPDKGEIYQPFEILPQATAKFDDKVIIFADGAPKQIPITVKALKDNLIGELQLSLTNGWQVDSETKSFEIAKKGDQQILVFNLTPPESENEGIIRPVLKIGGNSVSKELITIAYDHVPTQSVLIDAEARVVRLNIKRMGEHIGYIMGAGDEVPKSLEQLGYVVTLIDPVTIQQKSLEHFDAVVLGIRAYNVVQELKFKQRYLLDYVKEGGNLIVQYNTASRWDTAFENIAPYPLKLSSDRVVDEASSVEILAKKHAVLNHPNTITAKDFEGWVQERGLYFPREWDPAFTPILSLKDKNEPAVQGSLLVASYGKGNYIYTGLSFFRELPAGVTGAYRLFANMISLGKEKIDNTNNVKG